MVAVKKKTVVKKKTAPKKLSAVSERIQAVHELPLVLSVLLYGRSGTGKTTIAGSFPKPILLLDISEKGTDSVSDVKDLDTVSIEEWEEVEDIFWDLKDQRLKYATVVFDSVHALEDLAKMEAKSINGKSPEDQMSLKDFGTAAGMMKNWLVNYRDLVSLGINIVFLAHDRVTESDDDEADGMLDPEVGPRVMPSVASTLLGSVNVVGNTFIREQIVKSTKAGVKAEQSMHYSLRVGPDRFYFTKIRNPKGFSVPGYIDDPSYDKIVGVIKNLGAKAPATRKPTASKIRRKT